MDIYQAKDITKEDIDSLVNVITKKFEMNEEDEPSWTY